MSSEYGDRQSNDQPNPNLTAKLGARKKIRPTYSCLNCHKRKVKVNFHICPGSWWLRWPLQFKVQRPIGLTLIL